MPPGQLYCYIHAYDILLLKKEISNYTNVIKFKMISFCQKGYKQCSCNDNSMNTRTSKKSKNIFIHY